MFLTGFDATTLNTLFVDKNLRSHGLLQAYSRTNRLLNSVKTYGNIVTFRDLEAQTNAALELFGNKDARGLILLKPYAEYVGTYAEKVKVDARVVLLHRDFRERAADKESIAQDVVFEIELVKQVEVTVDYILMLVQRRREERGDGADSEIRAEITRAIAASPTLRDKRDLIEAFVDSVSLTGDLDTQWEAYVAARRVAELAAIITAENLRPEATYAVIDAALRDGELRTNGTAITAILPPTSRFAETDGHRERKQRVSEKLRAYVERFFGLASDSSGPDD